MSSQARKQKDKQNRRDLILQKAEEIMTAKGLSGLNLDLVAAETGLAKGTIYLYFKSKEDILSFLAAKAITLLYKEFEKVAHSKREPVDQLRELVQVNYRFYSKHPLYYDFVSLYEANNLFAQSAEMKAASEALIILVSQMAENAKAKGQLHAGIDPKLFTLCLWGMTVGIMQLVKVRGEALRKEHHLSAKKLLSFYSDLLLRGIQP